MHQEYCLWEEVKSCTHKNIPLLLVPPPLEASLVSYRKQDFFVWGYLVGLLDQELLFSPIFDHLPGWLGLMEAAAQPLLESTTFKFLI